MELPLPPHWKPDTITEVRKVPYEQRAAEAAGWAREHAVAPARDDERRVCLFAVDCQNTFCTPGFELFVPGAPGDSRRLCGFVYRTLRRRTASVSRPARPPSPPTALPPPLPRRPGRPPSPAVHGRVRRERGGGRLASSRPGAP